jgi:hypothetical protein
MILTWPDYCVSAFRWTSAEQAIPFKSAFGSQALDVAAPVWSVELAGRPELWPEAIEIGTFFESLRGYTNQIALWNLSQPTPSGTLRGSPTFAVDTPQGATQIEIDVGIGQDGATLRRGDLIGFGSGLTQQVVRVSADSEADSSGTLTANIVTPLRNAFASGAPIVWDKPKALFRQSVLTDGIQYQPKLGQPWALSLLEDWRPTS